LWRLLSFLFRGKFIKKLSHFLSLWGLVAGIFFFATQSRAQATRTWVSGVGDDVNPCSRTAPCKTFAGAISKTLAGGEINTIDAGAFGTLTITKSITINGQGLEAGVLASGTNGFTVNAGVNDTVTIRNVDIDGAPGTGLVGIRFLAGAELHVENVTIRNFRSGNAMGIQFVPSGVSELYVSNSTITDSGTGAVGGGIVIQPSGAGAQGRDQPGTGGKQFARHRGGWQR
jgi:hypothetical protein